MPSCLFGGPPVRDNVVKMGESQISFMNIFARPLFEGVTSILPAMHFTVDEIILNKATWTGKIEQEKQKNIRVYRHLPSHVDGVASPMSMTPRYGSQEDLASAREAHQSDPHPLTGDTPFANFQINARSVDRRRSPSGAPDQLVGTRTRSATQSRRSSRGSNRPPNSGRSSPGDLKVLSVRTPEMMSRRSSGASRDSPKSVAAARDSSNPRTSGQREQLNSRSAENQPRRESGASFTAILMSASGQKDEKGLSSETVTSKACLLHDPRAQWPEKHRLHSSTESTSLRDHSASANDSLPYLPEHQNNAPFTLEAKTERSHSDGLAHSLPELLEVERSNAKQPKKVPVKVYDQYDTTEEPRRQSKFGLKFWKKKRKSQGSTTS